MSARKSIPQPTSSGVFADEVQFLCDEYNFDPNPPQTDNKLERKSFKMSEKGSHPNAAESRDDLAVSGLPASSEMAARDARMQTRSSSQTFLGRSQSTTSQTTTGASGSSNQNPNSPSRPIETPKKRSRRSMESGQNVSRDSDSENDDGVAAEPEMEVDDPRCNCMHSGRPLQFSPAEADQGDVAVPGERDGWTIFVQEACNMMQAYATVDRHSKTPFNNSYMYDWAKGQLVKLAHVVNVICAGVQKSDIEALSIDKVFAFDSDGTVVSHAKLATKPDGIDTDFMLFPIKPYIQVSLPIQWFTENTENGFANSVKAVALGFCWLYVGPACRWTARHFINSGGIYIRIALSCTHAFCNAHCTMICPTAPKDNEEVIVFELFTQDDRTHSITLAVPPTKKPPSVPATVVTSNGVCCLCALPAIAKPSISRKFTVDQLKTFLPTPKRDLFEQIFCQPTMLRLNLPLIVADAHAAMDKHVAFRKNGLKNDTQIQDLHHAVALDLDHVQLAKQITLKSIELTNAEVAAGRAKKSKKTGAAGQGWHELLTRAEVLAAMKLSEGQKLTAERLSQPFGTQVAVVAQQPAVVAGAQLAIKQEIVAAEEPEQSEFDREGIEIIENWQGNSNEQGPLEASGVSENQDTEAVSLDNAVKQEFDQEFSDYTQAIPTATQLSTGELFYVSTPQSMADIAIAIASQLSDHDHKDVIVKWDSIGQLREGEEMMLTEAKIIWPFNANSAKEIYNRAKADGEVGTHAVSLPIVSLLGSSMNKIVAPMYGRYAIMEGQQMIVYVSFTSLKESLLRC